MDCRCTVGNGLLSSTSLSLVCYDLLESEEKLLLEEPELL